MYVYIYIYIYIQYYKTNKYDKFYFRGLCPFEGINVWANGLLMFEQPLPACYGVNTIPILNLVKPRAKPANQITYKEHV